MNDGWLFLSVLVLVCILGFMLRRWFLVPEAEFRQWIEAKLGPISSRVFKLFLYATVAVWLVIWATAGPDDRQRLSQEFGAFLKSVEWGQRDLPDTTATPNADQHKALAPPVVRP